MNKKQVMQMAVKLAKQMEGDWIARMALALKTAWDIAKNGSHTKIEKYTAKEWKNYGKHRLYVEGEIKAVVSNWGNPVHRKTSFSGYYDIEAKQVVMTGGKSNFKKEIFKAIREIAKAKGVA